MSDTLHQLVEALQQPALFPHPVTRFAVVETHISIILLTGMYAYKFKKAVTFGFLDFSTLEKRRHFCNEELRLNRRLAPELYLEVLPVSAGPQLGTDNEAIEYALRVPWRVNVNRIELQPTEQTYGGVEFVPRRAPD